MNTSVYWISGIQTPVSFLIASGLQHEKIFFSLKYTENVFFLLPGQYVINFTCHYPVEISDLL